MTAKISTQTISPTLFLSSLLFLVLCMLPRALHAQNSPPENEEFQPRIEKSPPVAPLSAAEPTIELRGVKQTDYIDDRSPYQREKSYLHNNNFSLDTLKKAKTIATRINALQESKETSPSDLNVNEIKFSLGLLNTFQGAAEINRYFKENYIRISLDVDYHNALGELRDTGYAETLIPNSEFTRIDFIQQFNIKNDTHLLTLRHLTLLEGLQELDLSALSETLDKSLAKHSIFFNSIYYNFNFLFPSSRVENLSFVGTFFAHYNNQFTTLNNTENVLSHSLFEQSDFLSLSFSKNIQHKVKFDIGINTSFFDITKNFDFLFSIFSEYRFVKEGGLTLELGLGYITRLEINPNMPQLPPDTTATGLPIIPKIILRVPLTTSMGITASIKGIAERVNAEVFYEASSPMPFNTEVFPIFNRRIENSLRYDLKFKKIFQWDLALVNDLYFNNIERIVLNENRTAQKDVIAASLTNPYVIFGFDNFVQIWLHPIFNFSHTLEYRFQEKDNITPALISKTSVSVSEDILQSTLSLTHFLSVEDLFTVVGGATLSRDRNELNLRYEILVSAHENQEITLFLEIINILNTDHYKSIPYLKPSVRLIRAGIYYIF